MGLDAGSAISVEDAVAGRTYWLVLNWNDKGTWRAPSYSGRILDYDAFSVTVEIDVMGSGGGSAKSIEQHPRRDLRIEEMPVDARQ